MIRRQGFVSLLLVIFSLFTGGVHGSAVLCVESNGRIALEDNNDRCCEETGVLATERSSNSDQVVPMAGSSSCGTCFDIPLLIGGALRPVVQPEKVKIPSFDLALCSLVTFHTPCLSDLSADYVPSSDSNWIAPPSIRSVVLRF